MDSRLLYRRFFFVVVFVFPSSILRRIVLNDRCFLRLLSNDWGLVLFLRRLLLVVIFVLFLHGRDRLKRLLNWVYSRGSSSMSWNFLVVVLLFLLNFDLLISVCKSALFVAKRLEIVVSQELFYDANQLFD
jgi:membrane protease YdiL (CAAX protease family)